MRRRQVFRHVSRRLRRGSCRLLYERRRSSWIGEDIDSDGDSVVDHETRFAYDGNQIVLQFDKDVSSPLPPGEGQGEGFAGSDVSHRYLWGPAVDQLLADERTDTDVGGLVVTDEVLWPLTDQLGSVRDLVIHDGQSYVTSVTDHRVYDSFGNLKSETNAALDCLFGFTGLPFDKASGFIMSATRPYDPMTGRWTRPDLIEFGGGTTNLGVYCGNSPTNLTDPSGMAPPKTISIAVQTGTVSVSIEDVDRVYVLGENIIVKYFVGQDAMETDFPIKFFKRAVTNADQRDWLISQLSDVDRVKVAPVFPPAAAPAVPASGPPRNARDNSRPDDSIPKMYPRGSTFNDTAEMLQHAGDIVEVGGVFFNEFVVKPYEGAGIAIADNILGTVAGVAEIAKSIEANGFCGTVLRTGEGAYTVVTTFNQWAPEAAKEAIQILLGGDNTATAALAMNIFMFAVPGDRAEAASALAKLRNAAQTSEAIAMDEAKNLIRRGRVLRLNNNTRKLERVSGRTLTNAELEVYAKQFVEQAASNKLISGTRGLTHTFDRHAKDWNNLYGCTLSRAKWQELIEEASKSELVVDWSLRGGKTTTGYLAKVDGGKWFFVQFFKDGQYAGELADAFIPNEDQLRGILRQVAERQR